MKEIRPEIDVLLIFRKAHTVDLWASPEFASQVLGEAFVSGSIPFHKEQMWQLRLNRRYVSADIAAWTEALADEMDLSFRVVMPKEEKSDE